MIGVCKRDPPGEHSSSPSDTAEDAQRGSMDAAAEEVTPSAMQRTVRMCLEPRTCKGSKNSLVAGKKLSHAVIRRVVRRLRPRIIACYERHLTPDNYSGKWSIGFVVHEDGWVERTGISDFTPYGTTARTNSLFERCIEDAFCTACFPKLSGETKVLYPLHFEFAGG
jgi:hypothetical protein